MKVQTKLSMTNCGLLYCLDCTARLSKRVCKACRVVGCKRSVKLNSKAPREVRSLFESFDRKINK